MRMTTMNVLQSEKHVVTLTMGDKVLKLFQISFDKDGSIYIHFPYHNDPNGMASVITLDASLSYPANNVSMTDEAKVTSHKIKFSHHASGEVLFSQDKKIVTTIRKQGVPLNQIDGHIFTISIQNPIGFFEEVRKQKDAHHYEEKRSVVNFVVDGKAKTFKFVALWKPLTTMEKELTPSSAEVVGPQIIRRLQPTPSVGFVLGQPKGYPFDGYSLTLCIEEIPELDKSTNRGMIMMIGGFDPPQVVNDLKINSTFLSLMYPTKYSDVLKSKIGSMDFQN